MLHFLGHQYSVLQVWLIQWFLGLAMLNARLTAAEEIVSVFEETVAVYEDRMERLDWSEQEISRQRRLLDAVMKPELQLPVMPVTRYSNLTTFFSNE